MPQQLRCIKCVKVDHSTRSVVYILVATFAGGSDEIKSRYVCKTVTDLNEFRTNVLQLSNSSSSAVQLPEMKEKKGFMGGWRDDRNRTSVDEFCQSLLKLQPDILREKSVIGFFLEASAADEDSALKLFKTKDSLRKPPRDRVDVTVPAYVPASPPSPAVVTSMSAVNLTSSSDPTNSSYSINTYEEIGYMTNSIIASSNQPLSGLYSEVKLEPGNLQFKGGSDEYAECVVPAKPPPAYSAVKPTEGRKVSDQTNKPVSHQPLLYAAVQKPKPQPQPLNDPSVALYEETGIFSALRPDAEFALYEDAPSTGAQRPVPPKPPLAKPVTSPEIKPPVLAPKPQTPVSPPTPLTAIPPMPQFPSPTLQSPEIMEDHSPKGDDVVGEIQVVAIGSYDSTTDSVLSFKKGTLASLLLQSDSNWWCIRLGSAHGWVPAAYWRMLNSGECANVITKGNSPWFVGKLSRAECEALLMEHGKQQHFVVRESNNSKYALSVKFNDKIHHFPIEVTADKKYNIGKHDFKTVNNVILYYQKNTLFHDDSGQGVTLGSPLVIIKQ